MSQGKAALTWSSALPWACLKQNSSLQAPPLLLRWTRWSAGATAQAGWCGGRLHQHHQITSGCGESLHGPWWEAAPGGLSQPPWRHSKQESQHADELFGSLSQPRGRSAARHAGMQGLMVGEVSSRASRLCARSGSIAAPSDNCKRSSPPHKHTCVKCKPELHQRCHAAHEGHPVPAGQLGAGVMPH